MPAEQNAAGLGVRARVALAEHRFAAALATGEQLRGLLPDKSSATQIIGDARLELGDVDAAAAAYAELARAADDTVATTSRLGRLDLVRGRLDDASRHLADGLAIAERDVFEAPDVVVWFRVQLGELAFKRGRWDEAERHYRAALAVAPEHWSALEHLAELEGARGDDADAVALYQRVLRRTPRAEVWQALGDLHAFMRRPSDAATCYARALADYRASVARGEVLYVHHLAGFFSDSQDDAAEAVAWARRDLELRHTIFAWDALAWALYRHGDLTEALAAAERSLATGVADPHLLYHAAMIHMSAGDLAAGRALLTRCAEVNPRFAAFHAHR